MSRRPGTRLSDFDYELPEGRIARYPADRRDESRLLVVDRSRPPGPGGLDHRIFREIVDLIPPGDVLVLNESRVFPARLLGEKPTGASAEVLLVRPAAGGDSGGPDPGSPGCAFRDPGTLWKALVRPGGKLKPGRTVVVSDELEVEIVDSIEGGGRLVRLVTDLDPEEALERHGHVPLPPYIDRDDEALDRERYQTIYARVTGSVAAPTAGLHFTPDLMDALAGKGVEIARVVLHVGIGTFRPMEAEDPEEHEMHAEAYRVPPEAAATIRRVRDSGGAVWAVGTTVARVLETVADADGGVAAGSGETDLFIHPPYDFRAVDHLVTNFHLPRSTLLMLVAAFAGHERILAAYRAAVAGEYRFYSYGDAMVIA